LLSKLGHTKKYYWQIYFSTHNPDGEVIYGIDVLSIQNTVALD
jgi:hypothetical protein